VPPRVSSNFGEREEDFFNEPSWTPFIRKAAGDRVKNPKFQKDNARISREIHYNDGRILQEKMKKYCELDNKKKAGM
jgi:hypothetical protein